MSSGPFSEKSETRDNQKIHSEPPVSERITTETFSLRQIYDAPSRLSILKL